MSESRAPNIHWFYNPVRSPRRDYPRLVSQTAYDVAAANPHLFDVYHPEVVTTEKMSLLRSVRAIKESVAESVARAPERVRVRWKKYEDNFYNASKCQLIFDEAFEKTVKEGREDDITPAHGALKLGCRLTSANRVAELWNFACLNGLSTVALPYVRLLLFDIAGGLIAGGRDVNLYNLFCIPRNRSLPQVLANFQLVMDFYRAHHTTDAKDILNRERNTWSVLYPNLTMYKASQAASYLTESLTASNEEILALAKEQPTIGKMLFAEVAPNAIRFKGIFMSIREKVYDVLTAADQDQQVLAIDHMERWMNDPLDRMIAFTLLGLTEGERIRTFYRCMHKLGIDGNHAQTYHSIADRVHTLAEEHKVKIGVLTAEDLDKLLDPSQQQEVNQNITVSTIAQMAITDRVKSKENIQISPEMWRTRFPASTLNVKVIHIPYHFVVIQIEWDNNGALIPLNLYFDLEEKAFDWSFIEDVDENSKFAFFFHHMLDIAAEAVRQASTPSDRLTGGAYQYQGREIGASLKRNEKTATPTASKARASTSPVDRVQQKGASTQEAKTSSRVGVHIESPTPKFHVLRPERELLRGIPKNFARQIYTAIDELNRGVERNFKALTAAKERGLAAFEIKSGRYRIILVPNGKSNNGDSSQGPKELKVFVIVLRNDMDSSKFMENIFDRIKKEQSSVSSSQ